jgi:hypothetical protein
MIASYALLHPFDYRIGFPRRRHHNELVPGLWVWTFLCKLQEPDALVPAEFFLGAMHMTPAPLWSIGGTWLPGGKGSRAFGTPSLNGLWRRTIKGSPGR